MTPALAKTLLPVLTAFSEGKELQLRKRIHTGFPADTYTQWSDYKPHLNAMLPGHPSHEWRIKPTPRTGRMCLTCGSHFGSINNEQVHNQHCRKPDVVQWVEVVT